MQATDLPSLRPDDLRWQQHAACRSADTALFFPEGEAGHTHIDPHVRALCHSCPVHADCLDHALNNHERGIWAATTPNDRKRMRENARKQRQRDKLRASDHGTTHAYAQHLDTQTTPCPPCQTAQDRAQQKRRARRATVDDA